MQINYEINNAVQTVQDDGKRGQPEYIRHHIRMARQSSVLSQLNPQKTQTRKSRQVNHTVK